MMRFSLLDAEKQLVIGNPRQFPHTPMRPIEVDGQTVGIAIMNHPQSFRFPTFWHVRTYGLFAANPFGRREFPDGNKEDGTYTLADGKSVTLRYRVWLHKGDEKMGKVREAYESYAK